MSKFEQLLTRYKSARGHGDSCIKKLQQLLEYLRSDWDWPQQEHKSTKHIYHNLRYESRGAAPAGHSDIFGHGSFTTDSDGGVHTNLSATVSEEHMQSPLSVRLSIARVADGKWKIDVEGTHLMVDDNDDAGTKALSEHIFSQFMSQIERRHWAPLPVDAR